MKKRYQKLSFKSKKIDFELNDGFLMVDGLLSMAIIGIITTIVLPTIITVNILDKESYSSLTFYRTLYLDIKSNDDWKSNPSYSIEKERICHKTTSQCFEINK